MDFEVHTLVDVYPPENPRRVTDFIDIEDGLKDPSFVHRVELFDNGRTAIFSDERDLWRIEGVITIKLPYYGTGFEIREKVLHAWTFFLLGVESVLTGKEGSGPFLHGSFYQIRPIKPNGIRIRYQFDNRSVEDFPCEEVLSVLTIRNKFAFARNMVVGAKKALAFFELVAASDPIFQTESQLNQVLFLRDQINSIESAIQSLEPKKL
jgi:hypothetical protein